MCIVHNLFMCILFFTASYKGVAFAVNIIIAE